MEATLFEQAKTDQTRRLSNAILRRTIVNVIVLDRKSVV